ncbi:Werner syndrome ATP-dependent helicase homolog isoform X24 [Strigops habroptila]|uniref:Werner syndrome ATP-dependent helicase homolog isoform X24 n=1 Tax=Strigops habroptila TaxID=2489341 RepID=UPI0011CF28E3|nr:Werner syndrome ATP-dependent helicase homolog isoform X24 [Strigops habroptila]
MNKMGLPATNLQNKYPQWMLTQSQEEVSGDKKKSAFQRSVLEDGLPFLEFRGSVVYSYEVSDCSLLSEDIRQSLSDGAAVGFDIEWPPSYTKGKMAKIAVIQICVSEEKCYLFHISSMSGFPKGLKRLLEDETIKKVGVGVEGDQWKLMSDFEIKLKSFVELADVANEKLRCKEIWSLNGLVKHLFGKQLLKDKSVRCSNWKEFPLNEEQKLYAATDAYAGFIIYKKLNNMNNSDQKVLCGRRDDMGVKEHLTSLAAEITDLASRIPDSSGQLVNVQRAAEIIADISENVTALRSVLFGSGCPSVLEKSCGTSPTNLEAESSNIEAQEVEMPQLAKQLEGDFNICSDATLAGFWEEDLKEEAAERGNTVEDRAAAASSKDKADREDFMSLDITEQELQVLEYQAAEEFAKEAAAETMSKIFPMSLKVMKNWKWRCLKVSCFAVPNDFEGGLQDFGKQAYQLLSAVSTLEEKFGTRVPILFLRGSSSQRLPNRYRRHPLFGSGKDWPENWWKSLCQQLIMEGFLKEVSKYSIFATTCVLTQKGRNWLLKAGSDSNPSLLLQSSEDLNLQRPSRSSKPLPVPSTQRSPVKKGARQSPAKQMSLYDMFPYERKGKTSPGSDNMLNSSVAECSLVRSPLKPSEPVVSSREKELETALYGKLLTARQKIANEKVIPPAVLATNKILVEMARIRPTTIENVKRIDGVSEAKSTLLIPLMAEIKDFCQENGLQTDTFSPSGSKDQKEAFPWKHTRALSPSEHVTYVLFQEKNLSVRTISESRSLPLSEVGTHLCQALKAGYPVNLERAGLTPEVHQMISDVIRNPPIESDTTKIQAIRKLVPANIELYLIRMTIALLEKEDRNKSWDGSGFKRMLVWSERQEEKTGADQANREDATWSKTKALQSMDGGQPGSGGAAGGFPKPITPVSPNEPALDPNEEELSADSESKTSQPPFKRKVPEWFGTSAATALPVNQTKKHRKDTQKGIFS